MVYGGKAFPELFVIINGSIYNSSASAHVNTCRLFWTDDDHASCVKEVSVNKPQLVLQIYWSANRSGEVFSSFMIAQTIYCVLLIVENQITQSGQVVKPQNRTDHCQGIGN